MHFTYIAFDSDSDLEQGDVLKRTPELLEVIGAFHPCFAAADYTNFIVLTQSCDLVRRGGSACSANYLEIAAVRPLTLVLDGEAEKYRRKKLILSKTGANDKKDKQNVRSFLERLLNNNNHEFFYLHEDSELGLVENSCAFLRLSVSLGAHECYSVVQESRLARLRPTFQAKLGWLVGNIYSRVGTDDWTPTHHPKSQWKKLIDKLLDQSLVWLDSDQLRAAEKAVDPSSMDELSVDDLIDQVKKTVVGKRKDQVVDAVVNKLSAAGIITGDNADAVRAKLINDPVLSSLVSGPAQ